MKIEELYVANIDSLMTEFLEKCRHLPPPSSNINESVLSADLKIIQDPQFRRLRSTVDMDLALKLYNTFR